MRELWLRVLGQLLAPSSAPAPPSPSPKELALEAYKLLVGLLQTEEQILWTRNQAFLAINGAMLAVLGFLQPGANSPTKALNISPGAILLAICFTGLILSLLWFFTILRSKAFYDHWFEHLRSLEAQHLAPIAIFERAETYFTTHRITFAKGTFRLPWLARLRIYLALEITSLAIAATWLLLGWKVYS